jgi:hypothetical protein
MWRVFEMSCLGLSLIEQLRHQQATESRCLSDLVQRMIRALCEDGWAVWQIMDLKHFHS